jgi:uncharacterized protein YuzE
MGEFQPYAVYDQDSDAIYVMLSDADVERSTSIDDFRIIDYSASGKVVGVEFLGVGGGVDLSDIPYRNTVERLINELNLGIKIFA